MKKVGVYLFLAFSWLLSKLPEFILYGFADIFYFILYKVVGYRKKIVFLNLRNSFPEKSETEINQIVKKFYKHLGDTFIENVALIKMSKKRALKMVKFEKTNIYEDLYKKNKSIVGIAGHYGNWEVFLTLPEIIKYDVLGVYKPLNNPFFDKQFFNMRKKFGAFPITMNDTYKTALKYNRENKPLFLGLIADQRPMKNNANHWTTFLNQETAVYIGPEKIAKKIDSAVIFTYLEKIKRGRYLIKTSLLFDDVSDCKEYEILDTYLKFLENLIINKPEYYLWSHNRWKHKRGPETPIH